MDFVWVFLVDVLRGNVVGLKHNRVLILMRETRR